MANKYLLWGNNMGKQHYWEPLNNCFEIALTPSLERSATMTIIFCKENRQFDSKKEMHWPTVCPWRAARVSSELQAEALGCQKGKDVTFPSKKKL